MAGIVFDVLVTLAGNDRRFLGVGIGYWSVILGVGNLEYGGIWLMLWLSRGQISHVDISEAIWNICF